MYWGEIISLENKALLLVLCLLIFLAGVSTVSASNVEDMSNNSNSLGTSDYENIALDTNSIENLDSSPNLKLLPQQKNITGEALLRYDY